MNKLLFFLLAVGLGGGVVVGAVLGRHSTSVPSADVIARGEGAIQSVADELGPNTTLHILTQDYDVAAELPGQTTEQWYAFDRTAYLAKVARVVRDADGRLAESSLQHAVPAGPSGVPPRLSLGTQLTAVSSDALSQSLTAPGMLPDPAWGAPSLKATRTTVRGLTAYAVTFRNGNVVTTVFFDARTYALLRSESHDGGPDGALRNRSDYFEIEVLSGDAVPASLESTPAAG